MEKEKINQFIHGIIFDFNFSFFVIYLINSNLCS